MLPDQLNRKKQLLEDSNIRESFSTRKSSRKSKRGKKSKKKKKKQKTNKNFFFTFGNLFAHLFIYIFASFSPLFRFNFSMGQSHSTTCEEDQEEIDYTLGVVSDDVNSSEKVNFPRSFLSSNSLPPSPLPTRFFYFILSKHLVL